MEWREEKEVKRGAQDEKRDESRKNGDRGEQSVSEQ